MLKKWQLSPTLYFLLLFLVLAVAYAVHLRRDGIFACPADGYGNDRYLGYCQAAAYGDYDHGAFWFGLEPEIREAAAAADVLFLGSSRLLFGFSTAALQRWFDEAGFRYFLLGFSHGENISFVAPLLRHLKPRARAYVINIDGFFDRRLSDPARTVMQEPDARDRYGVKRAWQMPHRLLCGWLPALCGNAVSFYRARDTGAWRLAGTEGLVASDVEAEAPPDLARVATEQAPGEAFIAGLGVDRRCVFLTYLPPRENERATAAALAARLGLGLISPKLDGLRTFDGSHLDPESAERFVGAFLEQAGQRLSECLGASGTSRPFAEAGG